MVAVTTTRQTFRKSERLSSRKILETLVTKGRSIHVPPFRMVWLFSTLPETVPAQIAFAVPKRNFKTAVLRNRIRRLMRESYRKNKTQLYPLIVEQGKNVALLFIFTGKEVVSYAETEIKTKSILSQLANEIKKAAG
jgi:ribonuclease P protein component